MEVVEVLHMNGGNGDSSYANNSLVQQKVILMTKPITEQAMIDLYSSLFPETLCIADLGCSLGANTFLVVSQIVKIVEKERKKHGFKSPEFYFHFNDLPGNDFNTLFQSLGAFQEDLRKHIGESFGPCFFSGVPGSFYTRLFPSKSLHFVYSSYSLMWLSQVPNGIENNKGNIYMARTSPLSVIKAYYKQYEIDFSNFLKYRSEELMKGGKMVLTLLGRESEDPTSKECCYIWELLAMALNELVKEGLIKEEKVDAFNIPQYTPSPAEVKYLVEKEGSFTINRLETSRVHWNASNNVKNGGYNVSRCMRAVAEPLLVSHFDKELMDLVFHKYEEIISDCMSKEKTEFINVIVSLTKIN
uniref:S-adenosyl-L-methionine:benzoic acid/salicylic acid carboxyl methyltransferase 3 n=1 Tax=Petunia hybrida TaxID=4102 RepID=BSMT3_PETHY|nr:RecName: Full=S-adenosyl-L-methionine:benzoic acid/salicylic acid carboxyl methyltransferase 3; Short=PhBSMT3 [Petunia x hybrida]ABF50941.1 S-adenosyl-L-methionine:benzoic acid/salicylic acid carboxyl methyltransferase [Petunia x hybrida]